MTMKKILGIPALVLFLISCSGEKTVSKSDLQAANLKGKVVQIDKTFHDAAAKCVCPAAQKDECNKSIFTYDEKGNLKETSEIDDNGNVMVNTKYVYNRKGQCQEANHYSSEKLVGKELTCYKDKKATGIQVFNEEGLLEKSYNYKYEGDQITEEQTVDSEGKVIGTLSNEFGNGQLVSQTRRDTEGNLLSVTKYTRNINNDIVEILISVPKDKAEYKLTLEYEYDEQGNWTKQTQLYNGEIQNITIRNITYANS
jgi:hypothetical protein